MKIRMIVLILLFPSIMVSCAPVVTIIPTETISPTDTPILTVTPYPTNTPTSSLTPMPFPINTPELTSIPSGTIYYLRGLNFDWENTTTPYLVWGAQLRDVMNGGCEGFICGEKDLREYDPIIWQFLGYEEYGKVTFTFGKPPDTFVIVWGRRMGFDPPSGTTPDGKIVSYGYLANGQITASYLDGGNFPRDTIIAAENNGIPVNPPCGIIDPNPDGDNNYNVTGTTQGWLEGAIFWNYLGKHPLK